MWSNVQHGRRGRLKNPIGFTWQWAAISCGETEEPDVVRTADPTRHDTRRVRCADRPVNANTARTTPVVVTRRTKQPPQAWQIGKPIGPARQCAASSRGEAAEADVVRTADPTRLETAGSESITRSQSGNRPTTAVSPGPIRDSCPGSGPLETTTTTCTLFSSQTNTTVRMLCGRSRHFNWARVCCRD